MKNLLLALLIATALFTTTVADAEEAAKQTSDQTTPKWAAFRIGVRFVGTIAFPPGEKATPKPMGTAMGVNMANPTPVPWIIWSSEVGAGSPNIVFNPAPYVFTGPLFIVLPGKLTLNPTIMYQWNPAVYKAAKNTTTHYLGAGLAPGIPITKEITFALPVGAGVTVGGPKNISNFNIGPKFVFLLPF